MPRPCSSACVCFSALRASFALTPWAALRGVFILSPFPEPTRGFALVKLSRKIALRNGIDMANSIILHTHEAPQFFSTTRAGNSFGRFGPEFRAHVLWPNPRRCDQSDKTFAAKNNKGKSHIDGSHWHSALC